MTASEQTVKNLLDGDRHHDEIVGWLVRETGSVSPQAGVLILTGKEP
jgi:hypothetical protein